jgi:hypothetical protein
VKKNNDAGFTGSEGGGIVIRNISIYINLVEIRT